MVQTGRKLHWCEALGTKQKDLQPPLGFLVNLVDPPMPPVGVARRK